VCDLETSRMGAPYIYDISHLRVKGTFFSDVMAHSLVQIYWGLEEPTTCTPMMKSVGSPAIAINFYQFRGPCIIIYSYNRTNEMH